MPSWFSIIQYLPDPIAGECINIGVIAFGDDTVRIRFIEHWKRVQCFAGGSVDFLKEFISKAYQEIPSKLFPILDEPDFIHQEFNNLFPGWINSIQVTEPCGSIMDVNDLIEIIYQKFVFEAAQSKPTKARGRQAARQLTAAGFRKVLKRYERKELMKLNHPIQGARFPHEFDVVVANGIPYFAAHGISFEVNEPKDLLDALAWRIEDIKANDSNFPVGIVTLPPIQTAPNYDYTKKLYEATSQFYKGLGADVVLESSIEDWVTRQVQQLIEK